MQRERRYRSKLLYLVRTSLEVCVDPQAECMQVVWGPWKLRTRRGMGITGMGGLLEPGTVHWGYWCRPLPVLLPGRQLASFAWTIWLDLDPLARRWFPPSFTQEGFFFLFQCNKILQRDYGYHTIALTEMHCKCMQTRF